MLGVLELLHGQGVYHRDISPDNILLLDDGRPVLLDFGSARRVMAEGPQSFTAHLKPQFAPLEQYAEESGGMRQGPWTDLYALGATLYFVLTGARADALGGARRSRRAADARVAGRHDGFERRRQSARDHRLDAWRSRRSSGRRACSRCGAR